MCGIVGIITDTNTVGVQKFIWQGLYTDALRGDDATGLATVTDKGIININKKALPAPDFLGLNVVDKQIELAANRVFIGHNRAATQGLVVNTNSHPFQHDHITMVHNGTLRSRYNLPDHHKFEVDSDNLAYTIAQKGAHEALKLANGAFALVWYDELEERVFMVRNSERPLHYATIKNRNIVAYASEANMLHFLVTRAGLTVDKIHSIPTHTLISFDPKSKNIAEHTSEEVEFYKYVASNNRRNTGGYKKNDAGFPHNRQVNSGSNQKGSQERQTEAQKGKEETAAGEARRKNIETMFNEVGLKRGDRLLCNMLEFKPYAGGTGHMGVWEGCTCHEPYLTVMSYGTTAKSFQHNEVYSMEAMSMQATVIDNIPKPIKEQRFIVDNLSSVLVSDEEFFIQLAEIEKGIKESQEAKRENKKEDKKKEKKSTIILAGESEKPTLEEEVAAYNKGIALIESGGKAKNRQQLQKEILEKKPILHLPSGVANELEKEEEEPEEEEENKVEFIYVQGPRGQIKVHEFKILTKDGCSMCTGNISVEDADHIDWWGEQNNAPICTQCIADWAALEGKENIH